MKIVLIGHSHIVCMQRADTRAASSPVADVRFDFLQLRKLPGSEENGSEAADSGPTSAGWWRKALNVKALVNAATQGNQGREALEHSVSSAVIDADWVVLCLFGNQHGMLGLVNPPGADPESSEAGLSRGEKSLLDRLLDRHRELLDVLVPLCPARLAVLLPPPPTGSNAWIEHHPGKFAEKIAAHGLRPPGQRLAFWEHQCSLAREDARRRAIPVIELPPDIFSPQGFLNDAYRAKDPTHGNIDYGERLLAHLGEWARARETPTSDTAKPAAPADHPYRGRPDYAFWRQAMSAVLPGSVDPVVKAPFRIGQHDRIATAGSCFAQHISKRLRSAGFNFMRMEDDTTGATGAGYEYSARYGNVYTARQLLQLLRRAFGRFSPRVSVWPTPQGRYCDPFRPRIEAEGYDSPQAVIAARDLHLAAVRRLFEELDLFIFTLGLTECWTDLHDGAAYPLAPGVAGGRYDPEQHAFHNFRVSEIESDLDAFISELRQVNPGARVILTVSPVPLAATYEARHVLVSTTYSKSVLRVAAESAQQSHPGVYYFPSYEIIIGNHAPPGYFGSDLRSISEQGVDHVMRLFMHHLAGTALESGDPESEPDNLQHWAEMETLAEADCDEALLSK